jgi:hypothetical protein
MKSDLNTFVSKLRKGGGITSRYGKEMEVVLIRNHRDS